MPVTLAPAILHLEANVAACDSVADGLLGRVVEAVEPEAAGRGCRHSMLRGADTLVRVAGALDALQSGADRDVLCESLGRLGANVLA